MFFFNFSSNTAWTTWVCNGYILCDWILQPSCPAHVCTLFPACFLSDSLQQADGDTGFSQGIFWAWTSCLWDWSILFKGHRQKLSNITHVFSIAAVGFAPSIQPQFSRFTVCSRHIWLESLRPLPNSNEHLLLFRFKNWAQIMRRQLASSLLGATAVGLVLHKLSLSDFRLWTETGQKHLWLLTEH